MHFVRIRDSVVVCIAAEDTEAPADEPEAAIATAKLAAAEPIADVAEAADAAAGASNGGVPVPVEPSSEGAGEKAADAAKKDGKAKKAKGEV